MLAIGEEALAETVMGRLSEPCWVSSPEALAL
jgi:hypothetical protein